MIRWRLHLAAAPAAVFEFLASDDGRARFWAESAVARADMVDFVFPGGLRSTGRVLAVDAPRLYAVEYFGAPARFALADDGAGGTDLTLEHDLDDVETHAGWVSVLLALKAAADFGVDLRNHNPARSWEQGYVDN